MVNGKVYNTIVGVRPAMIIDVRCRDVDSEEISTRKEVVCGGNLKMDEWSRQVGQN